ncbi:hypothetical protein JTE90_021346 [Oedothorax gibbosus]|uniref:Fucosyltransferase n=1 Tax=Oedothorax gibbosus TaxID=931172 RepID=A0AAV6TX70_9ARAC|nr:hypothetical protein JTE90_021346 [Oedothorax gibbosus]
MENENVSTSVCRKMIQHISIPYIPKVFQKNTSYLFRSRLLCILLFTTSVFVIFTLELNIYKYPLNIMPNPCTIESLEEWVEIRVPGQVRTVRVKANSWKSESHSKSSQKTILLWTTFFRRNFSDDFYFFQEGQETFEKYNCRISNCFVTANRSLLPHVDAVLFHASDLNTSDIPQRIRHDQIWIIYSMEATKYGHFKWHVVSSRFNWTMTYRSDSDVQVRYGEIVPFNGTYPRIVPTRINVNGTASSSRSFPTRDHHKRKGAIWMVSNCRTESRREAYVKELRKHFKVDVYGRCSRSKTCQPPQSSQCYGLLKKYGFYLSFENAICKDYVTEKFFNVLMYDVVPVVFGGAPYKNIAPKDSFIDATQFANPKDLAVYLSAVLSNSTLYNSFSKWKNRYRVHLHAWMCDLCERLHEKSSEVKVLSANLWSWWVPGASCRKWTKKSGFQNIF